MLQTLILSLFIFLINSRKGIAKFITKNLIEPKAIFKTIILIKLAMLLLKQILILMAVILKVTIKF